MGQAEAEKLSAELAEEWEMRDGKKLRRLFIFQDFRTAMEFVKKIAEIAEQEQHHPDIAIHYNKVTIELWTHAIGGLSENDFIMAAKIDQLSL